MNACLAKPIPLGMVYCEPSEAFGDAVLGAADMFLIVGRLIPRQFGPERNFCGAQSKDSNRCPFANSCGGPQTVHRNAIRRPRHEGSLRSPGMARLSASARPRPGSSFNRSKVAVPNLVTARALSAPRNRLPNASPKAPACSRRKPRRRDLIVADVIERTSTAAPDGRLPCTPAMYACCHVCLPCMPAMGRKKAGRPFNPLRAMAWPALRPPA
jgi:hypothetical protein